MATVLGIGEGLFVVIFIWAISLLLCILLTRAQSNIAKLGPVLIILAAILTVILVFIPRQSQFPTTDEQIVVYDYSVIYRSVLLAVLSASILAGLGLATSMHFTQLVRAKPIRKMAQ